MFIGRSSVNSGSFFNLCLEHPVVTTPLGRVEGIDDRVHDSGNDESHVPSGAGGRTSCPRAGTERTAWRDVGLRRRRPESVDFSRVPYRDSAFRTVRVGLTRLLFLLDSRSLPMTVWQERVMVTQVLTRLKLFLQQQQCAYNVNSSHTDLKQGRLRQSKRALEYQIRPSLHF